jgi:ERCC4-related helicase
LHISHVEMRCEEDNELAPYIHHRLLETVLCECDPTAEPKFVTEQLIELMKAPLRVLHAHGMTTCDNANNLNIFVIADVEK